jgi:hypothetical protein
MGLKKEYGLYQRHLHNHAMNLVREVTEGKLNFSGQIEAVAEWEVCQQ